MRLSYFLPFLLIVFLSCASTQKSTSKEETKNTLNLKVFFYDSDGLKSLDLENDQTKLLASFAPPVLSRKVSPDQEKVAFYITRNDSSVLKVLNTSTEKVWKIDTKPNNYLYTFEWSPTSDSLAVGYYSTKESGEKHIADEGGIFVASFEGGKRILGCSTSKSVEAWIKNSKIVVSGGLGSKNIYLVDRNNCNTLKKISKDGKNNISFSPDSEMMLFTTDKPVYNQSTGNTKNVSELYIFNLNNEQQTKVAGYQYEPKNAVWSPNGDQIAFDIQSQEWSNIRHLSIYDVKQNEAKLIVNRSDLGNISSDKSPNWSKSGNKILFERSFEMNRVNKLIKKVIRDLNSGNEVILDERINNINNPTDYEIGGILGWVTSQLVAFSGSVYSIYDTSGNKILELGANQNLIFAKQ